MDPLSVDNSMVKALEQVLDQIVAQELASHKPDAAKAVARQRAADFKRELARVSGEMEQARIRMAAAPPTQAAQAKRDYAYWQSQLGNLESEKMLSPSDASAGIPPLGL